MTRRNVFFADVIWNRLVELAKVNGTTVAELIRRAVLEFLKREEGE